MNGDLRQHVTGRRVADKIRQLRESQAHLGPVLIVEGHDDRRAYSHFVHKGCRVEIGEGFQNVVDAIKLLHTESVNGVLALIDADFRRLEGAAPEPNVIWTDEHDLEVMLIGSSAFERLVLEHTDPAKVDAFIKVRGTDLRALLFAAATPLGLLRWHNHRSGLGLKFTRLTYSDFIDGKKLTVDIRAMVKHVRDKSTRPELDVSALVAELGLLEARAPDVRQLCCGHDLTSIFAVAIQGTLGPSSGGPDAERLESTLRVGWQWHEWTATGIYRAIQEWEANHGGFVILATAPHPDARQ